MNFIERKQGLVRELKLFDNLGICCFAVFWGCVDIIEINFVFLSLILVVMNIEQALFIFLSLEPKRIFELNVDFVITFVLIH